MNDDLIRRGDALEALNKQQHLTKSVMRRVVMQVPAVDAVEVVRCKDCRMSAMLRKQKDEVIADCMLRRFHTDDEAFIEVCGDDFCSYGVRREDDG